MALTWAFIWASALYSADFGHNTFLRTYFRELSALARAEENQELVELRKAKEKTVSEVVKKDDNLIDELVKQHGESLKKIEPHCRDLALASAIKSEITISQCREIIQGAVKRTSDAYYESTVISLPGGFGKFSIGDLAIVGQFGLLLILSWCFFATRRENHAVRSFVDMEAHSRNTTEWFPVTYILEPQGRFLLAEHFAYAYRSVAQRFMFLFSQHSKPLLAFTILLCVVPALVASWNAYTDLRDLLVFLRFRGGIIQTEVILFKMLAEVVLLMLVWIITCRIIRFDIETSMLLNGWQLAVQDVWMANWNAARLPPARVKIDVRAQTGQLAYLLPPKTPRDHRKSTPLRQVGIAKSSQQVSSERLGRKLGKHTKPDRKSSRRTVDCDGHQSKTYTPKDAPSS